jgi:DNA-binding MarR family transcriptional regulator
METVSNPKESATAEPLVRTLIELLRQLIRTRSIRDPVAELFPQMTAPQVHVLMSLGMECDSPLGPALTTTALANRIHASLPTMTGVIDRMERDGFVVRERDPHDRRVVMVRLTPEGERVHVLVRDDVARKLTEFLHALEPHEREPFVATMQRAVHVLMQPPAKPITEPPSSGSSS